MVVIEKVEAGVCCFCPKPASKRINGLPFCPSCGDGELIKIIGRCIKAVEQADVTIKIIPKRGKDATKKGSRKT